MPATIQNLSAKSSRQYIHVLILVINFILSTCHDCTMHTCTHMLVSGYVNAVLLLVLNACIALYNIHASN